MYATWLAAAWLAVGGASAAEAPAPPRRVVRVSTDAELRAALRNLRPGTTVSVAPGRYRGGHHVRGAAGTKSAPIVVEGADANRPPVVAGGPQGFHFADCAYLTLRRLVVKGFSTNGVNIDDGGTYATPAHHVTIEDVRFAEIGPRGNHDALKLSGVDHFVVRRCRFEGWGGSAIDMVGCHHGVIEDCRFAGKAGHSQDHAVQIKGGSRHLLVQTCFFHDAGQRAINIGGGTGLRYFRPKVGDYEAKDVTVAGNRFVGSLAPVAFATACGGHVHHNTIYLPRKWVLRILQETRDERFRPCGSGVIERNLIVTDRRVGVFVNVGAGTAPETFVFRGNAWYRAGDSRRPVLPAREEGGVYGVDPKLQAGGSPAMSVTSRDPRLRGIGADGYRKRGR